MTTTRQFRFGVQFMGGFGDLADVRRSLRDQAQQAEALGYEDFFVADHFGSLDPFLAAMAAAEATSSLRIGTLVLNNEFHEPAMLARAAATVDLLSEGRFVLGCGTGYTESEHDATGIELRPPGPRVDRFGECMQGVRELLRSGAAVVDGHHVHLKVASLGVRPAQDSLPILIGGHGRRVVGIAARYADIFQFTGLHHGVGGVPNANGFALDEVAQRALWLEQFAGERNGDIERSALVQGIVVSDNVDHSAIADRAGVNEAVARETPFLLAGSVGEIVDKLERLRETLDITHFVIRDAARFAPVVAVLSDQ